MDFDLVFYASEGVIYVVCGSLYVIGFVDS